jgi:hypothetical protein
MINDVIAVQSNALNEQETISTISDNEKPQTLLSMNDFFWKCQVLRVNQQITL